MTEATRIPTQQTRANGGVVSSLEGHQVQKEEETSGATLRPRPTDAQPPESRTPGRRETSVEGSLPTVRKAHQKVLTMAAALKGVIERLSHPLPQSWPEVRVRSKSRDCKMHGAMKHKRRHCQV